MSPIPTTLSDQQSSSPSIREWEKARATLASSLKKYLDLCCSLGTNSAREGIPPRNLATQIDSTLETYHATLESQLVCARSALSQTRNRIMSPIYQFPEEVLSHIFAQVVYTPLNPPAPVPMKENLVDMYRSIYTLLGVCTVWRNVILGHKPFWSMVPVIKLDTSPLTLNFNRATQLSLERSGCVDLHLAAILVDQYVNIPNIGDHIHRFRTLNITAKSPVVVHSILQPFFGLNLPSQLTELSVKFPQKRLGDTILPDYDHIFHVHNLYYDDFNKILKGLSTLRLCGAPICLDHILFSSQLVELHIQEVTVGDDTEIVKLLNALSVANQLRDLRIVSVTTFPNATITPSTAPKISLPGLRHLLVQDLFSNTMGLLLQSITSRSHHLTLFLTEKCVQVQYMGEPEPESGVGADHLCKLLEQVSVDTLVITGGESGDHWLHWSELGLIMKSTQDLKTLRMSFYEFDQDACEVLKRPLISSPNPTELSLPALESIYLSCTRIWNVDAFKDMIASYSGSLRRLVLGGGAPDPECWNGAEPLIGGEDIVLWLEAHIPEFELKDEAYFPPELELPEWQLW